MELESTRRPQRTVVGSKDTDEEISLKPKMWGLNLTKVAGIFKGFASLLLI